MADGVQRRETHKYDGIPTEDWKSQGTDNIPGPHISLEKMALSLGLLLALMLGGIILFAR